MNIKQLNPKEAAICEYCGEELIALNEYFIVLVKDWEEQEIEQYCIICLECEDKYWR